MPCTQVAQRGPDRLTYDDGSGADKRSANDSSRLVSVQSGSLLLTADAARFPLEVFEDIIDAMNTRTLLAAAQVCAAWYPRAMRNLYYAIEISGRRSFDILFKQRRTSPYVKQWLATTRELRVRDGSTIAVQVGGRNPRFLHALPPALGHALFRVQRLAISGLRGDEHPTFFLGLSQFSSVVSLELSLCSLNHISQLRRIIYTFPLLTTLTLEDIQIAPHDTVSSVGASFRSPSDVHLRHLHITAHRKPEFIDWIAQSDLCASIEDLTIWLLVQDESARQSVGALLKSAGSSLTQLQSHIVHGDLVHNTALRSLDLYLNSVPLTAKNQGLNTDKLARQLHGVLSTVRSHELEHIAIATSIHCNKKDTILAAILEHLASALEHLDLRALHAAMSQPCFDALKAVDVKMDMRGLRMDKGGLQRRSKAEVEEFSRTFEAMFRGFLRPWSDRGIVKRFTWVRMP
ncbi:uncharacterized protein B0H18DRAFT_537710 [Fomitopsis serialis]|uniref:uncharacterized protein n=1 Tax=Fomitopsis serialis TaxID=139415 RepID=UPI002007E2F7|nr:uncharacterized protein B0H18DRAFT_537710 [Neoantrodia serialis]KAH9921784.1 hypothetical protein B0H18DRAFT_537710 [Neoantrodia serialis]